MSWRCYGFQSCCKVKQVLYKLLEESVGLPKERSVTLDKGSWKPWNVVKIDRWVFAETKSDLQWLCTESSTKTSISSTRGQKLLDNRDAVGWTRTLIGSRIGPLHTCWCRRWNRQVSCFRWAQSCCRISTLGSCSKLTKQFWHSFGWKIDFITFHSATKTLWMKISGGKQTRNRNQKGSKWENLDETLMKGDM